MARGRKATGRRLRYEDTVDPDFQKRWIASRELDGEQVDRAFRHGFDARGRFADRPFDEVEAYLRESWEGMGADVPWRAVRDIVRSGYERYKGAGFDGSIDLGPEALDRFPVRNITGSTVRSGTMDERPSLGAAERTPDFEGEGGPPVGGHGGEEDAGSDVTPPPA